LRKVPKRYIGGKNAASLTNGGTETVYSYIEDGN
jgi:hypothetical protein